MNDLDFNIDNYSLEDLLRLFKINIDFNEKDLKRAKGIVLNTHPDKSRLPNEYFFFFSKAYKIIYDIYLFKNKNNHTPKPLEYENIEISSNGENNVLLEEYLLQNNLTNTKNFNKWFNENFEKVKNNKEEGYGDWLKSEEDIIETNNLNKNEMNTFIQEQKRKSQQIIPIDKIEEFSFQSTSYYDFNEHEKKSFGGMTSSLRLNDLKHVHTETLIPVVEEPTMVSKYKNVNEMKVFRDSQDVSYRPMNKEESLMYLQKKDKEIEETCVKNAFYYAQQTENMLKKEEQFWSSIKNIKM
jgi:hypothetical protein